MLKGWAQDRARVVRPSLLREQSLWALLLYRAGRAAADLRPGLVRTGALRLAWAGHRVIEVVLGISLPLGADIGPGLRIHHLGGIFVSSGSVLGANCTLRQGVTVGNRHEDGPSPVIEDGVDIGAYAQILGDVRVGTGARIGALAVVLHDVPAGATAVGIPATVRHSATHPAA